ncbi:poly [ADP-ribose] polymerase tankyrase-2-like isoform X2 [Odontomachus brunneus]|uniref:poly [ADP-ribose] polymerase tankyrase-2-like isoform X2 n=1 Tax=Odontomachus brunneus TaxID=486640 RepID=UPI0013F181E6|nr:poly [ADP-ribose] polymerase tankyrase-2-like isoform X2 [Odontomachus brunneus]
MASVDSGVETGNDSNDSSIVQHESQHATTIVSPVATAANISAATIGQDAVDEVASVAITDTCKSNETFLPSPSYLMTFKPHWPVDRTLCSVSDHCKLHTLGETSLAAHDTEHKWHRSHILMRYERTYRRRIRELKLKTVRGYNRLPMEEYSRLLLPERGASYNLRLQSECVEWRKPLNERRMRLAAATNDVDTVKELLRNNVSPNNHDVEGRTPLHHAACRGYSEIVHLLLAHGADPNKRDRIGNTPLHLAAVTSKISVVTLLLAAGTNVRLIDQYGFNPLHLAQAKLKMLQNCKYGSMVNVKEEMHSIVGMLMTYFNKQKNMKEQIETLNNFCSRLSLSNTSDQVQDDVKDLLANIKALDITS